MRSTLNLFLLAAPALLAAGCGVTVPASDSTEPNLTLYVRVGEEPWTEVPADEGVAVSVPDGETVYLWALANDDGGVKKVAITGTGQAQCATGNRIETELWGYSAVNEEDSAVGVGDSTESSRGVTLEVRNDFASRCPEGYSCLSATVTATASAENFHGGTAESEVVTISKS